MLEYITHGMHGLYTASNHVQKVLNVDDIPCLSKQRNDAN